MPYGRMRLLSRVPRERVAEVAAARSSSSPTTISSCESLRSDVGEVGVGRPARLGSRFPTPARARGCPRRVGSVAAVAGRASAAHPAVLDAVRLGRADAVRLHRVDAVRLCCRGDVRRARRPRGVGGSGGGRGAGRARPGRRVEDGPPGTRRRVVGRWAAVARLRVVTPRVVRSFAIVESGVRTPVGESRPVPRGTHVRAVIQEVDVTEVVALTSGY